jgi:hypothetical protein
MLDVDRRENVDPGREQLLDILITLRVTAAGRVGVGELIDQDELRPTLDQPVKIHLGERTAFILDLAARHDLEPARHCFRFRAAMGFDHADHDIDTGTGAAGTFGEHLIGLADPGRRTEEDLQTTTALLRGGAQKGLRIGPLFFVNAHGAGVAPSLSSCRLRRKRFTRSSPRKGRSGRSIAFSTRALTCASGRCRALATRGT